jgi:hypothetical protein
MVLPLFLEDKSVELHEASVAQYSLYSQEVRGDLSHVASSAKMWKFFTFPYKGSRMERLELLV